MSFPSLFCYLSVEMLLPNPEYRLYWYKTVTFTVIMIIMMIITAGFDLTTGFDLPSFITPFQIFMQFAAFSNCIEVKPWVAKDITRKKEYFGDLTSRFFAVKMLVGTITYGYMRN